MYVSFTQITNLEYRSLDKRYWWELYHCHFWVAKVWNHDEEWPWSCFLWHKI